MSASKRRFKPSDKPLTGSYEANADGVWTRSKSQAKKRSRPSDSGAGVFEKQVRITPENIREAFSTGVCPWCGEGPFRNLAAHTNRLHGIDRVEIRDLAQVNRTASICSPELHEAAKANASRRISEPAFREKFQKASERHRDYAIQRSREAVVRMRSGLWRDVLQDYSEGMTRSDIADKHGITKKTISEILKRYGVWEDGRATSGPQAPSRRDQARTLKDASLKALERKAEARIDRFAELGSDWSALIKCAEEFSCTPKSLRAFLAGKGVQVPDGRAVKRGQMSPELKKRYDRYIELGANHAALKRLADELGITHYQHLRESLREHGAPVEDGRTL